MYELGSGRDADTYDEMAWPNGGGLEHLLLPFWEPVYTGGEQGLDFGGNA